MIKLRHTYSLTIISIVIFVVVALALVNFSQFGSTVREISRSSASMIKTSLLEQYQARAMTLAGFLAGELAAPVNVADHASIAKIVVSAQNINDVNAIYVYGPGLTIIHDGAGNAGKAGAVTDDPLDIYAIDKRNSIIRVTPESLRLAAPIMIDGQLIGGVNIEFSLAPLKAKEDELSKQLKDIGESGRRENFKSMAIIVLGVILAAIALSALLARRLSEPIVSLSRVASRIGKGDYDTEIDLNRDDEIGELAHSFSRMRDEIKMRGAELEKRKAFLEDQVKSRTQELITANKILETELSERLKTQKALEEMSANLRTLYEINTSILENSPVGILRLDSGLRIEYENPEIKKMIGVPEGEESKAIGMKITELESVKASGAAHLFKKLEQAEPIKIETFFRSIYGKEIYMSLRGMPVMSDGEFAGAVIIVTDISDIKKVQENLQYAKDKAVEATRIKGEFLANMSHEIRTPLSSVIGFAKLISDTQLTGEQRLCVNMIINSGDALLELVNDLLDFSKIEAGTMKLERIHFDLRSIVERCAQPFAVQSHEKGLEFLVSIGSGIPEHVIGDPERLRQILINLLSNAVKFTEEGEIEVSVTTHEIESDSIDVHFMIRDTGVGISEDKQKEIFESFTQADGSMTRKYGGAGLGTTISKSIIELMGGRIWLQSELGKGSDFHFVVPLIYEQETGEQIVAMGSALKSANLAEPDNNCFSILLVEDIPISAQFIEKTLEKRGHRIDKAFTGQEAVEKWETGSHDIVLMDVQMQGMDGLEAARLIREKEVDKGTHTPIIAVTANAMHGDREKCIDAGMDDYIQKPIDMAALVEKINILAMRRS